MEPLNLTGPLKTPGELDGDNPDMPTLPLLETEKECVVFNNTLLILPGDLKIMNFNYLIYFII